MNVARDLPGYGWEFYKMLETEYRKPHISAIIFLIVIATSSYNHTIFSSENMYPEYTHSLKLQLFKSASKLRKDKLQRHP